MTPVVPDASAGSVVAPGERHRELWEVVRDELRDLIIEGEFKPGERLVESTLSERFAVSRGPVRTALMELERLGLVVSTPRRGVQVATFSRRDINELYDVTLALERAAAREAAPQMTPTTAGTLREFLDRLAEAERKDDRRAAVEADLELHRQIMVASGNRRLYQIWTQLAEEMRLVIAVSQRALPQVGWADRNRDVLAALDTGSPDAAESAIVRYFERAHHEMGEVSDETLRSMMGEKGDLQQRPVT